MARETGLNVSTTVRFLKTPVNEGLVAPWNLTPTGRIVLSDRVVPINVVDADMRPGARLPDLVGAVGRCVAAQRGYDRNAMQQIHEALRWQNSPGFEAYRADVQRAREDGFAFGFGTLFKGLNMAAAVVRDLEGVPKLGLSAISISDQNPREEPHQAALALKDAASYIETNVFGRRDATAFQARDPG